MTFIKNIKRKFSHILNARNLQICYSQEGEDVLIDRMLQFKKDGFYIDVGAYQPVKYSNTYKFYLKGWKGINIDAMPGSMAVFNKIRPRDINIESPISDKNEELVYHIFNEPALNTLSKEEASRKNGMDGYRLLETRMLQTKRLDQILEETLQPGTFIDFLTVDAEGFDLKVLQSNNWDKFRPFIVLTENLSSHDNLELALNGEVSRFMTSCNYRLTAKTLNTLFFLNNDIHLK